MASVNIDTIVGVVDAALALGDDARDVLIVRVKLISWLSLVWMTVEGVIGTTVGIMANSIALIGYGVDSTITGIASVIIIWRFSGDRVRSNHAERRAQRIVAITFFLLAPYIIVAAIHHLVTGSEAQASWVGIGLAIVSVTLMPIFGRAKRRIGERLQSPATTGEGTQNILCAYLSLAILIGLAANAILGLWWADPLVALIVATVALQTGARTWRGQTCEVAC
jgi:divalent metal cation (Fe/Co/Zn/Cd) transporter